MYSIEILPEVQEQIDALPIDALPELAQALVMLELTPWSGDPTNKERPERNMRVVTFGPEGVAMMVYLILEDQRRVIPLTLFWL